MNKIKTNMQKFTGTIPLIASNKHVKQKWVPSATNKQ